MALTVRPLVVAEGGTTRLALAGLTPGRLYRLSILPVREPEARLGHELRADAHGQLVWNQEVTWRGEALCDAYSGDGVQTLATLHLYAAPPEILRRRPLRCDLHIHTTHSDGKASPAEMILRGRELGLDALAITDHNIHESSLEAVGAARQLGLSLLCLRGEEVSAYNWHILAIEATESLGWANSRGGYAALREAIDRTHALGGRAYLCHPYWTVGRRHHLPTADYERLLAEGGLDGIELLGDIAWEDNLRSLARYSELAGQGWPILGNSDTHGAEHTYGGFWTLVWAEALTTEALLRAIAEGYSVACALMTLEPPGQPARPRLQAFGRYELVDLAFFLDQHYFPHHDALCREEAELGRRALGGDVPPEGAMAGVATELEAWYRACWGRLAS